MADAKAKGKGKRSGHGDEHKDDPAERPSAEVLTAQLCKAIHGGASAEAEDLFSRLDSELRRQDSVRLQNYVSELEAAAVAALPDDSDSSGDEGASRKPS
ncbi:Grm5 [Symbiodinium sp. CCMP2456]|nr:Grm5 [Symbiodinium sp. CCMP2456]